MDRQLLLFRDWVRVSDYTGFCWVLQLIGYEGQGGILAKSFFGPRWRPMVSGLFQKFAA